MTIKEPPKNERILKAQLDRTRNRFQAEQIGEHALRSTVAVLQSLCGGKINRRCINSIGRFGEVHSCEYWIDGDNVKHVREILKGFWKKRGFDLAA